VQYTIVGTATNNSDYNQIPTSITIAVGDDSATIDITPIDDNLVEGNETVLLTLVDGTSYDLGTTTSATVTIADNDSIPVPTVPTVFGGINPDTFEVGISSFDGNNTLLFSGGGNDLIDTSTATIGNNRIFTGGGDDKIIAGKDDLIFAGEGNDEIILTEGQGGNRVYAGAGNDTLILGAGDRLFGGSGNDRFFVGAGGNNIITGGEGADEF
jgi:Ca2+-binding RTX toxin-like protein